MNPPSKGNVFCRRRINSPVCNNRSKIRIDKEKNSRTINSSHFKRASNSLCQTSKKIHKNLFANCTKNCTLPQMRSQQCFKLSPDIRGYLAQNRDGARATERLIWNVDHV